MPPSFEALTDALQRDLDDAGFASAHLVGNSLGAAVALELAKRGRASSVVAFSPAAGWQPGSREEKRVISMFRQGHAINRWAAPRARAVMRRSLMRRFMYMRTVAHPGRMDPDVAADAIIAFARARVPEILDNMEGRPLLEDLDQLSCPVLVAWVEKDRIVPRKRYAKPFEAIPGVQYTVLPDVDHVPRWDDPQLVADTILQFATTMTSAATR